MGFGHGFALPFFLAARFLAALFSGFGGGRWIRRLLRIKRVELGLVHRFGGVLDAAVFDRAQGEFKPLIRRTGLNATVGLWPPAVEPLTRASPSYAWRISSSAKAIRHRVDNSRRRGTS